MLTASANRLVKGVRLLGVLVLGVVRLTGDSSAERARISRAVVDTSWFPGVLLVLRKLVVVFDGVLENSWLAFLLLLAV